ncbi:hypothetical protein NLI96_g1250 [Meripilus lineatus]|uniref:Nitronate monooxygenase domain-containing protein n=1 Tax=Meripilus lineatus TaxID=2056292 RepID=A0AAD5YL85_9APHY|nr:hypothetical protein NLI96_g1250 [Physisporinus lineatus]
MAIPGIADMAIAVSQAGGFGLLGTAFDSSEAVKEKLSNARSKLNIAPGAPIPIGVGFIGWVLDKPSDDPRIQAALDQNPTAIWFAFGDDLGEIYRADALRATNEWKVDALVVQGIESGGHGGSEAPPLIDLLQAVLTAIPNGPLIVAAGGIATGAQIASLLTMGADGVVLGTRFLFTHECGWSPAKKGVIVSADLSATTRNMAFDEVNKSMGWPEGCDGRAVANKIIDDQKEGLSLEERLKRFDESAAKGETDRLVVWAGIGVGLTKEIKNAADVVKELNEEIIQTLEKASRLLV